MDTRLPTILMLSLGPAAVVATDAAGQDAGPAARVPGQPGGGASTASGTAVTSSGEGVVGEAGTLPAGQRASGGPDFFLFIIMGVFAFMIFSMIMSTRKQKKQAEQLMSSLGRGDTVQTGAGIIGVIGEIRDDIVVLKIDDATHAKLKVTKSSIVRVVKPAAGKTSASDSSTADGAEAA